MQGARLKRIGSYFIGQADAAPLLLQIDDETRAVLLNVAHGHL